MSAHQRDWIGTRVSAPKNFFVIMLAVAALFIFSACSSPLGRPAATPTPQLTAQQILTNAKNAKLTDETFTLSMKSTAPATPEATPSAIGSLSATATGKATTNPERISMSMNMTLAGTQVALDMVMDVPTKTTYTKITAPASLATNTWQKSADTSGLFSASDMQLLPSYDKITNPKLIGSEQVNGVDVWHVQGTTNVSGTDETLDVFVRKADYLPAKMVAHMPSSSGAGLDVTVVYTAVNTGISIDLPTVG